MNTLPGHITCKDISYGYSKKSLALEHFSHEFNPGIILLKGFSGCGKSTLLRLLAGFLKPSSGTLNTPNGKPYRNLEFQRNELGFVFQQLNLLPLASLQRNLEIAGAFSGLSGKALKACIEEWLRTLGLEDFNNRMPSTLSGGQQQRAAIARALIKSPTYAFFDEPTSGLDDLNTQVIINTLRNFSDSSRFIIIASHDARLEVIADEIIDFNIRLPLEGHLASLV